MAGNSDLVDVEYDSIKIDEPIYEAVLFVIDGEDVWLPRRFIEIYEDDSVVVLPEWLAVEKGLEWSA